MKCGYPDHGEFKVVTVNIPVVDIGYIKKFIEKGIVFSRSEYVRTAVRNQINRDLKINKYVEDIMEDNSKLDASKWIKIPGYNGDKPVQIIRRLEY